MPCPCSAVAIASWEIRVRFARCFPLFVAATSDTRESVFVGWWHAGEFERGDRIRRVTFGGEPPARRKGVARGSIRKYQTGNCSADCLSACGYFRADSWWRMGFLFSFFFFFISRERISRVFLGIKLGTNRRLWWRTVKIFNTRESVKSG